MTEKVCRGADDLPLIVGLKVRRVRVVIADRGQQIAVCLVQIEPHHRGRGSDVEAGVIAQAVEHKLRDAMKDGIPKPLTTKDLTASAGQVKPSIKEWFATARNYALYSNQGGTYDDILKYLKM